jgi:hypothetical protein
MSSSPTVLRASDSQAAITRPGAVGSATATLTLTARIATLPDAEQRLDISNGGGYSLLSTLREHGRLGRSYPLPSAEFTEARGRGPGRTVPRFKPQGGYAPVMDAAWYPPGGP